MASVPNKDRLWATVKQLGFQKSRYLHPFKFQERGGLSSSYVKFVSDIDLIFTDSRGGVITDEEALRLFQTADDALVHGLVYAMQIKENEDELFDEELEPDQDCREIWYQFSGQATMLSVTGAFEWGGFWIPMDITLMRGGKDMTKAQRKMKIISNLEDGNYAKAVQRIRSALSKGVKPIYADAWNQRGGYLRYLVKQGDLLFNMMQHGVTRQREAEDYLRRVLRQEINPSLEDWHYEQEEAMQEAAKDVLGRFKDEIWCTFGVDVMEYLG